MSNYETATKTGGKSKLNNKTFYEFQQPMLTGIRQGTKSQLNNKSRERL